ncbi:MAG: hypothetical protein GF308_18860 [Candidatus Heimdallarchaeota archaeon]|nr:hypothetical protein [Candidatus Heimdallarchaeota archaeon]
MKQEVLNIKFSCLPTGIGSLPFKNEKKACDFIFTHCPEIPFWPQLPKRDPKESMYEMFTEHLPGIVQRRKQLFLDSNQTEAQELFYIQFINNPQKELAISQDYAAGLHRLLCHNGYRQDIQAIKGQITGPISFGLQINDETGKPILYNDLLLDIVLKNIKAIIRWQEKVLSNICQETIIFIDEPYMSMIGSTIVNIDPAKIQRMMNELIADCKGKIGVHCCANTDWSILLNTDIDVLSFDAYEYADNLLIYREELARFLRKGGVIAWGLIPTASEQLARETTETLFEKFDTLLAQLEEGTGLSQTRILESSLISPACGLGAREVSTTIQAFSLNKQLSEKIQKKYSLR